MSIALTTPTKFKLRVEDFDTLAENGGLAGLERAELLDGDIYAMNAQYSRHSFAKSLIYDTLLDWTRAHRPDLFVRSETSVAMPPNDEPMPDVILTSQKRGPKGIPVESVALLVEIANESRDLDLGYKAELYARQGVPEYWVVDLQDGVVVRHTTPSPEGYAQPPRIPFGEPVEAQTLAALSISTDDLIEPLN